MNIVAAPGRQFKTYSMLLAIALGSFDALLLMLKAFADIHVISNDVLLIINAVASFLIVPAKLIQQYIPLTTEQKVDLVEAAAAQPVKVGQQDVSATTTVAPA